MIVYDRVADQVYTGAEQQGADYVLKTGETRPARYIVYPAPDWALEEFAAQENADFDDERDTQRCALD